MRFSPPRFFHRFFAHALAAVSLSLPLAAATLTWKNAEGDWANAAQRGSSLPGTRDIVGVEGNSHLTLKQGEVVCSEVDLGAYHGGTTELEMTGGSLSLSKLLRIGEAPGTAGRLIQRGGDINALEICVGGANLGQAKERGTQAELAISGGEILTRHLTLGWACGSNTTLRISGSKAAPSPFSTTSGWEFARPNPPRATSPWPMRSMPMA